MVLAFIIENAAWEKTAFGNSSNIQIYTLLATSATEEARQDEGTERGFGLWGLKSANGFVVAGLDM